MTDKGDTNRDTVKPGSPVLEVEDGIKQNNIARQSTELEKPDLQSFGKIDKELAKYVGEGRIEISEAEDSRLRRLIDKRVLAIMITTYFLQAIDKGTMSFASIMGIREDTGLIHQQVSNDLTTKAPSLWLLQ